MNKINNTADFARTMDEKDVLKQYREEFYIESDDVIYLDGNSLGRLPKKTKALPTVLSIQEVKSLIDATSNLKHKCIISLLYSGGLRRSELCNLQIIDVLSDKMQLKIRNGKGYKDRYVNLSHFILGLLREYYPKYKPKKYLFEGSSEKPYSGESVLKVVKAAEAKAKHGPCDWQHAPPVEPYRW